MAYAQFLSTDYIYKWTIIPDNVDADIITKFIRESQDIYIQDILGHDLYFKLMADLVAGGSTGNYLTLLNNYVMPAQAEWTVYNALPFIWARITNKSLSKKDSDNSTPTTKDELIYIRDLAKDKAEYYSERIREFILNNQGSFPEYWTVTGIDRIQPRRDNYSSGIYTGKSLRNGYNDCGDFYKTKRII